MDSPVCKDCAHFRQHYILDKQRCTAIDCGHCTRPRLKHRRPNTSACIHFLPAEPPSLPDRNAVIRYLTTEMLEYILTLELPPEVGP